MHEPDEPQLRPQYFILLCVTILQLLFLMTIDGKAADSAANYPSQPIVYVTHSSPGGNSDTISRLVSDVVQKEKILSQPLAVLNKPGSGGGAAMGYVFERRGNPYIILNIFASTFICTTLMEKLPYNIKSFTPIANLIVEGSVLAVRSDSPFKTIDDLIAEARKRPKELIQGGSSFTGSAVMMGRSIQKMKGVQWNFISFKSDTEALLNVLNGTAHFSFTPPDDILDYVRTGKLRVLVSAAPNRYPEYKDTPTMKEAGMGEPILRHCGILGPPNMPDYAVKKLEAAFKKVSDGDRFKKFMRDSLMQPAWMSSVEYGKLLGEENDQWMARLSDLDLLKKK
jgi:putative tricarboxylic transport membrane protein